MRLNCFLIFFYIVVASGSFVLSNENRFIRALSRRGGARYGYSDEEAIEFLEENDVELEEEEEELAAPVPATKAENVGVQFMITNKMRRVLEGPLGYLPNEVDEMDPQIASVVIDRTLSRPSKGMPESWKRNRRPTDEYNDESFPGREDGSEGDDDSRRVFAPRESILSSVKRIIVHAKDSIMGFGRAHIVPVLPTLFIGVCMYGVAVNSPHLFSFLSGVAEKTHRKSLRWINSVRRASSSPAQIKPLKIKICDPGDDNSHINNSKKMKVPESDMNSKASKKVTSTPTAPRVIIPPRRSVPPEITVVRVSKRTGGVDLEALAAAQHVSLWETLWLRVEMFKRRNF